MKPEERNESLEETACNAILALELIRLLMG